MADIDELLAVGNEVDDGSRCAIEPALPPPADIRGV